MQGSGDHLQTFESIIVWVNGSYSCTKTGTESGCLNYGKGTIDQ